MDNMSVPTYHVVMDVDCTSHPIMVDPEKDPYVNIKQRLYRTSSFYKDFKQPENEPTSIAKQCKEQVSSMCACTSERRKKFCHKLLPFIKMYQKYNWKLDLPSDIIAGFTVGIMQLPQSMAYSMLADLPPVVGLYMSFFPVMVYFFFGTSRHISMGTVAVVSLMTGSVLARLGPQYTEEVAGRGWSGNGTEMFFGNSSVNMSTTTPGAPPVNLLSKHDIDMQKIAIVSSFCLLVGIIQVIFGACRLGFVTTYMSDPLVSGFTTGAAVHVFTSQVKYIFGLDIPRFGNLFQIVYTYKAIFSSIHEAQLATVVTSAVCIVFIYLVKVQINQRFKDKLKVPLPIELFVVIIGTVVSHFAKFKVNYDMKVVGEIPAGLPDPILPTFTGMGEYFSDAVIVAIVAFAQSVSLASLMAKKHGYVIDSNQEFVAYGFGNIFGSFFSCYPFAASVSRSSVQDSAGGKSQITSLFSAALVLVVILIIGPLFESLPNCVLSSIIVVALRSMFLQIFELKKLWKVSGFDCMIWIVTFLAVVILYVDLGLWIGLIFSFFTVVLRTQRAKAITLQRISDVDIYADDKKYMKTRNNPGVRVISFNSPLYYANGDIFLRQIFTISGLKPQRVRKEIKRFGSVAEFRRNSSRLQVTSNNIVADQEGMSNGNCSNDKDKNDNSSAMVHHIVLDFASVCFVDSVGCKVLNQLFNDYRSIGVKVFLASVSDDVWSVLKTTGFLEKYEKNVYMSVNDAVVVAISEGESFNEDESESESNAEEIDSRPEDRLLAGQPR
ncbi:solute carrier family 26 member 10-like isoform X2 [Mizuhopecten yessoensis]|uniref:Prestin n=1 Tax=Mizuhopecten yessoensis TaxID=6573 RepID=A0A210PL65_MIZYE|nr:solute carrier family 26 member 10-like isoform X2 [Mizuhopecten yessoensis]OWF37231.1 Prestin [Mizuhopecten yessoensis]